MYITRFEANVMAGRTRELESLFGRLAGILQQQPGFLRSGVANSLGHPGRYAVVSLWESREVAEAARRTDQVQTFLAANPITTLATVARPLEAYEVVHRIQDQDIEQAGYVGILDFIVETPRVTDFEERQRELLDLRLRFGHGIISNTIARYLGGPGRYMALYVHTDQEAATRTRMAPEVQRFNEERPLASVGATITNIDLSIPVLVTAAAMVR